MVLCSVLHIKDGDRPFLMKEYHVMMTSDSHLNPVYASCNIQKFHIEACVRTRLIITVSQPNTKVLLIGESRSLLSTEVVVFDLEIKVRVLPRSSQL